MCNGYQSLHLPRFIVGRGVELKGIQCFQFGKEGILNPVKAEDHAGVGEMVVIVEKH